jgi:threonine synthase
MNRGVIESYKKYLPLSDQTPIITMGEGQTPLIKSTNIVKSFACENLYFKFEGCNPTGSFKDRGMVFAIAKALESNSNIIACASTGNTSASASAYGARFNLKTIVIVPNGNIASGKLAQAIAYGAKIISIDGNFDQGLSIIRELSKDNNITVVNSINPYRIEGQKTAAFEIIDELGDAPDFLFIPVGNAGNITAYWKGFTEYLKYEKSTKLPKLMGYQAVGAAPLVSGVPVEKPETVASAIRIGNPASWEGAISARNESGGAIDSVTDEEILEAYRLLASKEGIFCEPASAASLAGLIKTNSQNPNSIKSKTIVCVVTGSGLKEPELAEKQFTTKPIQIKPELDIVKETIMNL